MMPTNFTSKKFIEPIENFNSKGFETMPGGITFNTIHAQSRRGEEQMTNASTTMHQTLAGA